MSDGDKEGGGRIFFWQRALESISPCHHANYLDQQSLGNPKAILIFTAFLPQFVSVGGSTPVSQQFLQLGVLFLLLEWAAIAIYAGLGAYLQRWFERPGPRRLFNRVSASLLGCAGLGLLAARR